MSVHPFPRRDAIAGFSAAAILAGLSTPVFAEPGAIAAYHRHQATLAAVNASDVDGVAEAWNNRERDILEQLAATPGDLSDLLQKVIIMIDRSDEFSWNLMAVERDLLASMREQAAALVHL